MAAWPRTAAPHRGKDGKTEGRKVNAADTRVLLTERMELAASRGGYFREFYDSFFEEDR